MEDSPNSVKSKETKPVPRVNFGKGVTIFGHGEYGQGVVQNEDGVDATRLKDAKNNTWIRGQDGMGVYRSLTDGKLYYGSDFPLPTGSRFEAPVALARPVKSSESSPPHIPFRDTPPEHRKVKNYYSQND